MTPVQAVILGIIQGLTEFLPISSTAHLKVIPDLLGWNDPGAAFTAVIQWGTWLASVIYFWNDIVRLTRGFFRGLAERRPFADPDSRLAWLIIAGTIPIVLAGLLLEKYIKGPWRSLYVIAGSAIVLAMLLALAEWWTRRTTAGGKDLAQVGWFESILVGLAQTIALIPGASRSGTTITGGLFAGLNRATAARFSFLLSLPAVFGAGLHQLWKERHELLASQDSITNLVIATVVAGIVGYLTIAWLLRFLRTHTTWVFIGYRLALGVALLVLLSLGMVKDSSPDTNGPTAVRAPLNPPPASIPAVPPSR
jgi:undecaprenyl-diphosphatase